jgi:prepilin peptidase CpaA
MQPAILIIAIGLLAVIAYGDVRTRRIPNALCLAIVLLGTFRIILAEDATAAGHTLAVAAVMFAAAFVLFWRGAVGGGDAKLVAAMALLVGHHGLFDFLVLMSFLGGALALAIIARDSLRQHLIRLRASVHRTAIPLVEDPAGPTKSTIPYGAAIAAAGVITLITAR